MDWRIVWTIILVGYIIFIYVLLALKKKKYTKLYNKPFSVIIPCYNEKPKYLDLCVSSCMEADGEKEIILVNDGSNKKLTIEKIKELEKRYSNLIVIHQKNQGKRFAHKFGLTKCSYDLIILVDSDTIIKKDAFIEIIKPFADPKIGVVSGNVKLANRKQNFLTKVISSMYWTSFNIYRGATGSMGYMHVCPGCLSAHKKEYLKKLMPHYITQKFLGRKCIISDDRYLTLRVQMIFNKKVIFQEKAISYTFSPHTVGGFFKQLLRWKLGVLRESFLLLKAPNKRDHKLLLFDVLFNLIISYTMLVFKTSLLVFLITLVVLGSWVDIFITMISIIVIMIIFSMAHSLYMIFFKQGRKEFGYKILYTLFYEFFFFATIVPATLGIRKQGSWITR